jgi:DNA-directed RNA polymerase subunit M/transcription elongation factor TFIIS
MPIRPCPVCEQPTVRWLEESSKWAHVNYYRCEKCGNVWTVSKDDPEAPIRVITK